MELNKLYQGDAYELIKKIDDKSVDCIYTDIPYLIESGGCSGGNGLAQRIGKTQYELGSESCKNSIIKQINELKDKLSKTTDASEHERLRVCLNKLNQRLQLKRADIVNGIDYKIFDEYHRVMKKVNLFIWCSKNQIPDILFYWKKKFPDINHEILLWIKDNPTPATNNVWLPDVEYCLYFREKGVRLNDGYHLKSKWYKSPINKSDKDLYGHPTIKPLELVERHLKHTTQPNDVVLDTFMGSGTTCLACKHTGRRYIGFELDKDFYKIACDRLNGIDKNGQTSLLDTDFDKLQEEHDLLKTK